LRGCGFFRYTENRAALLDLLGMTCRQLFLVESHQLVSYYHTIKRLGERTALSGLILFVVTSFFFEGINCEGGTEEKSCSVFAVVESCWGVPALPMIRN
jgi:hypothetical protein